MDLEIQSRYEELLKVPLHWRLLSPTPFSPFDEQSLDSATRLAREYLQHAEGHETHTRAVHHVLNKAFEHRDNKTHDPDVIRYALLLFAVHHPGARQVLAFPKLIQRAPRLALPSKDTTNPLAWWMEDPNMNEHHEHWHLVYPSQGIRVDKDRQGEIFGYMHKQMLARYDAERLCNGLPIENAYNFDESLPGYTPSIHLQLRDHGSVVPYATRSDGLHTQDWQGRVSKSQLKTWTNNIQQAIHNGHFNVGNQTVQINPPNLGAVIEPSIVSQNPAIQAAYRQTYGTLHNLGHMLISYTSHQTIQKDGRSILQIGVMSDTRVACRDPVFWQWHRLIDNLYSSWQDTQPVRNWTQDPPPPVNIKDIVLAFNDTIGSTNQSDINQIRRIATTELQTTFLKRNFTWTEDDQMNEVITYLFPREFTYYFNVQNTSSQQIQATFRVFIVPTSQVDSRIHWIELDKFSQTIPASTTVVVSRDSDLSSVIRKPAQKKYTDLDATAIPQSQGNPDAQKLWCDCGWPYHLLLPKGSATGVPFKLFVFTSDWSKDQVPVTSTCGSLSFCGATDKYPDARPMGYPFDTPFKNGRFSDTFQGLNNCKELDITIKTYPYPSAQWANQYAEQPQPN